MELSWSTFLLEIFNFLILVWILKHFLYKPVREVIARRQQGISKRLADAKAMQEKAEEMQQEYTSRLDHWRREQQKARETLDHELQAEQQRREKALHETLEEERQRIEKLQRQQNREEQHQLQRLALEQGSAFASRLLALAAGPELELRLGRILKEALQDIPEEQLKPIRKELSASDQEPEIASAFSVAQSQRDAINETLSRLLQRPVKGHYVEDPELLAGFRITVGAWELGVNLRDELRGFARIAREPEEAASEQ